jgi:nitroreductase
MHLPPPTLKAKAHTHTPIPNPPAPPLLFHPSLSLDQVPFFATLFSTGHRFALIRWLAYWGKRLTLSLTGLLKPVPRIERPETWASKNTMLAAMAFMLAATAHGLSTCPMEGFDARRVRRVLRIPRRYALPVLISLGYEASPAEAAGKEGHGVSSDPAPASLRFGLNEVVHEDRFGSPWPVVE